MKLYLDDNCAWPLLARLLIQAGHDVELPRAAGLSGADDPVHFTHAIREVRGQMTYNYKDFEDLHQLVIQSGGHHPGVLAIRRDNNPRRDLTPRGIVTCLERLLADHVPVADQFIILNHWR